MVLQSHPLLFHRHCSATPNTAQPIPYLASHDGPLLSSHAFLATIASPDKKEIGLKILLKLSFFLLQSPATILRESMVSL